ncbi:hypothetical protein CDAR_438491 [Caerostris darwini]|uniref:Uncharacterized protein n=1 Tax=Caerostris darwini TaxID=1538125 RepID=A0AAV4X408_9ARAC|nr:hypothetical protein CDAR_438491 [Caerostris darwini]
MFYKYNSSISFKNLTKDGTVISYIDGIIIPSVNEEEGITRNITHGVSISMSNQSTHGWRALGISHNTHDSFLISFQKIVLCKKRIPCYKMDDLRKKEAQ